MARRQRKRLKDDPIVRLVRQYGYTTTLRAAGFVTAWSWVTQTLGHEPTMYEYAEYWRSSLATAYREQEAFKKITGLDTPAEIVAAAEAAGYEMPGRRDEMPEAVEGLALLRFLAS